MLFVVHWRYYSLDIGDGVYCVLEKLFGAYWRCYFCVLEKLFVIQLWKKIMMQVGK